MRMNGKKTRVSTQLFVYYATCAAELKSISAFRLPGLFQIHNRLPENRFHGTFSFLKTVTGLSVQVTV